MARIFSPCSLTVLLAAGVLGMSGCQSTPPEVAWSNDGLPTYEQQHQDWWSYQFVYHPQQQVYYEPYTKMYFWFEDGTWFEGLNLPEHFQIEAENTTFVRLPSEKPWMHHDSVTTASAMRHDPLPGSLTPENFMMDESSPETAITTVIEEDFDY